MATHRVNTGRFAQASKLELPPDSPAAIIVVSDTSVVTSLIQIGRIERWLEPADECVCLNQFQIEVRFDFPRRVMGAHQRLADQHGIGTRL